MKKFSIWCDTYFWDRDALEDYEEETRDFLMKDGKDEPSDYEIYRRIQEENGFFYEDERANLGAIDLPENIICIANLGLWNGNRCGYREFDDLADCMQTSCDYAEWYVDQYGNFRGTGVHHDGTNEYLYRMWKPGLSDEQRENFMWKIYTGKVTPADVSRYTVRLGDYIDAEYSIIKFEKLTVLEKFCVALENGMEFDFLHDEETYSQLTKADMRTIISNMLTVIECKESTSTKILEEIVGDIRKYAVD